MKLLALTVVLLAAVGAGILVSLPPARLLLAALDPPTSSVVAGVSHIHTERSDGTGTLDAVAEAASRAGLQFIVLTDHGDGTRPPDAPQYRHGVLCLDAVELTTAGGHYIGIGMLRAPYPLGGDPRDVVEDVRRLGGFGVVAHPDSPKDALRWQDWGVPFDAIEWLNADSEWRDEPWRRLARALATYGIRPVETLAALLERPDVTLRRWDVLTQTRPVVGLAGNDTHARIGLGGEVSDPYRNRVLLRLPSYETSLSTFSMRVELPRPFSGEASADASLLLESLRAGRLYSVIAGLAGPSSFEFAAKSGAHVAKEGESLELDGPLSVDVRSNAPAGSSVALFGDGKLIEEQPGATLHRELPSMRGVLRVEVRLNRGGAAAVPWIVSNPIYVSLPAASSPNSPTVTEAEPLDEAAGAAQEWRIEHGPASDGTIERAEAGRIAVRYALGAENQTATSPFVALVLPGNARLKAFNRVSFRATADKPMRVSIQLRSPGGVQGQRWRRSVYLDEQPREVTVFWNDMRPAGVTSTVNVDLASVEDLLFVVDTTNTAAGQRGMFSIEGLRLAR